MENTQRARLMQQMRFVVEVDKVKSILRRNRVLHGERHENDAEHSWHLAMMAIILSEYAAERVDVLRVVKMVLIHDLVEIDAGDTFPYDETAALTQREREARAADRVFGLLPDDQRDELRQLWEEFERRETPEARFAVALDRMGGVLPSCYHQGGCWREAGVTVERVKARNSAVAAGSPALWEYAECLIDEAFRHGFIGTSSADAVTSA